MYLATGVLFIVSEKGGPENFPGDRKGRHYISPWRNEEICSGASADPCGRQVGENIAGRARAWQQSFTPASQLTVVRPSGPFLVGKHGQAQTALPGAFQVKGRIV